MQYIKAQTVVCVYVYYADWEEKVQGSVHISRTGPHKAGLYKAHFCNCMYHAVIGYHRLSKQAVSNIQMATRNVTQIAFWRGYPEFDL